MFLNITNGSSFAKFDGDIVFRWFFHHSFSLHNTGLFYYHYYQSEFGVKLPGMEVSQSVNLMGPIKELFPVSNTEIEQCSWGNSTFIKVPVDIYLLSPYLYHLGILTTISIVVVKSFSQTNSMLLDSTLNVETSTSENH